MQTILLPIDFSDVTNTAIDQAAKLAERFASRVWLIHVAAPEPGFVGYDPGPDVVRYQVATELKEEHRLLHDLAEGLRSRGVDAHALLLQGATVEVILERARKVSADLIVLGSHGRGALYRALVGSVTEGVVRHSPCPVLIVPAKPAS